MSLFSFCKAENLSHEISILHKHCSVLKRVCTAITLQSFRLEGCTALGYYGEYSMSNFIASRLVRLYWISIRITNYSGIKVYTAGVIQ